MAASFYFYDLETSGFSPREARVMQFAGQRTDMDLKPVGEPTNVLIKISEDVLPDPQAILITGITPQQTIAKGITEAEFLQLFHEQIATPGTIFVGYNTIRFDDEFMRFMHYRNFYDAYEWQWQDERSRWDLLDTVRMTRALRPEGITWPFDLMGKPVNRLELLAAKNGLDHVSAHDALSDVKVSIELARLLRDRQPRLFDFLLQMRDKKKAAALVYGGQPFVYTSGKYAAEFEKTTIVATLAEHPQRQGALVYDLRYDPEAFATLTPQQLAAAWSKRKDEPGPRLPVKTLQFNRCPAIAPLSVLDAASQTRLGIDLGIVTKNYKKLEATPELKKKVLKALEILDAQQQKRWQKQELNVDAQLYDGFFAQTDKKLMQHVRSAGIKALANLQPDFQDSRLRKLLPLYKARNYPASMTDEERAEWESYRAQKLVGGQEKSRLNRYFATVSELELQPDLTTEQQYLLEELTLYGQSIIPVTTD